MLSTITRICAGVLVLSLVGCGGKTEAMHPVKGKITLKNGQPVAGAMVEFVGSTGSQRAKTDSQGNYELQVPAGSHRIAVMQMAVADGAAGHVKSHHAGLVVHPRYAKLDVSGLTRDVQAGPNQFDFTLDPAVEKTQGW